jgi:GMP synthase (glutamine-hydrolysing)
MNNICILEAGFINPALEDKYPTYTKLFSEFLMTNSRKFSVSSFKIYENEFPKNIQEYNSFIITGSSFGVYENYNWIIKTLKLINKIISCKKQLVGICFGHQLIIQAMNGLVEKYSEGWSTGINPVKFNIQKPWLPKFNKEIKLISFHQDQVIKIPNFVEHLAETNFCKYYALSIGDYVFTIKGHPEF